MGLSSKDDTYLGTKPIPESEGRAWLLPGSGLGQRLVVNACRRVVGHWHMVVPDRERLHPIAQEYILWRGQGKPDPWDGQSEDLGYNPPLPLAIWS